MVKKKSSAIIFIMETKSKQQYMETIRLKLKFENFFVVNLVGKNGDLTLLWNRDQKVKIIDFSLHHVHARIMETGQYSLVVHRFLWDPEK